MGDEAEKRERWEEIAWIWVDSTGGLKTNEWGPGVAKVRVGLQQILWYTWSADGRLWPDRVCIVSCRRLHLHPPYYGTDPGTVVVVQST